MKTFKVAASRFELLDPPRNPFIETLDNIGKGRTTTHTWEFKAKNKQEVVRLWEEAKRDRLPEVIGFTLDTIEIL